MHISFVSNFVAFFFSEKFLLHVAVCERVGVFLESGRACSNPLDVKVFFLWSLYEVVIMQVMRHMCGREERRGGEKEGGREGAYER